MSDVTQAAERLRRFAATDKYSEGPCPVYGLVGDRLCNAVAADRRTLADAYLALQERDKRIAEHARQVIQFSPMAPACIHARAILAELGETV